MNRKSVVVTDHELASLAGAQILKQGGNAADAAVASAAALCVLDPYMAGLGGFGYLVYYSADEDKVYALDFIGTSPSSSSIDLFLQENPWEDYKPTAEGPMAALVPGSVAGWGALLERFGKFDRGRILQPAINMAKGFLVTPAISRFYRSIQPKASCIASTANYFYRNRRFPAPGKMFSQPELARTLELIATNGTQEFYVGSLAKRIAEQVEKDGGLITLEDLASYTPKWREPVKSGFLGSHIYLPPPGCSGFAVLEWLNLIEKMIPEAQDWRSTDFVHAFLETGKLAMRDEDIYNSGNEEAEVPVAHLVSKDYASLASITLNSDYAKFYPRARQSLAQGEHTTNHCVSDSNGNVASFVQTQMYGFDRVGMLGDLGFTLNGGMCYFSLNPGDRDVLRPKARPRFPMTPAVARTDTSIVAIGGAGGWTIPQNVTAILIKRLMFTMSIKAAVNSPRYLLRYRWNSVPYVNGTVVDLEKGLPYNLKLGLEQKGHTVSPPPARGSKCIGFGVANALETSATEVMGAADPRRRGYAAIL
ncbi:MAG: gamma-glutamyltransferase [Thermoprotei archaeon]